MAAVQQPWRLSVPSFRRVCRSVRVAARKEKSKLDYASNAVVKRYEGHEMRIVEAAMMLFAEQLPTMTSAKRAVRRGKIRIGDSVVDSTEAMVNEGETLTMVIPVQPEARLEMKKTLEVVYEDEECAVITKPPNMAVHGKGRTLVTQLARNLAPSTSYGAFPGVAVPCHRLDARTGGAVVCAKTRSSANAIGKAFEDRRVSKTYIAVVHAGKDVDASVPRDGGIFNIDNPIDGRRAVTQAKLLKWIPGPDDGDPDDCAHAVVALRPVTGRKHQLRIHLTQLGMPIVGDVVYGSQESVSMLYLWAAGISFPHPTLGMHLSAFRDLDGDTTVDLPDWLGGGRRGGDENLGVPGIINASSKLPPRFRRFVNARRLPHRRMSPSQRRYVVEVLGINENDERLEGLSMSGASELISHLTSARSPFTDS